MLQHLPPDLKDFIDREVASGRFHSETEVIEEALARMADEVSRVTVAEAVAEADAQMSRGEGRLLTDAVFEELLARSEEDAAAGKPVRDDIRY